jgi:hypothetical protein
VEYEEVLRVKNTRAEHLPLDVGFEVLGDIHSADYGEVTKIKDHVDLQNPDTKVSWRLDLEPGERKELHVKYAVDL